MLLKILKILIVIVFVIGMLDYAFTIVRTFRFKKESRLEKERKRLMNKSLILIILFYTFWIIYTWK